MDAHLYGSEMVGQHGDAYGLFPSRHLIIYRGNETLIEILNGLELQVEVAIVTSLVAGLHMDEHEVVVFKCLDGCLSLTFVVGVGESCSTFHLHNLQSGIMADASDEINGRDYRTRLHLRILRHECLHRGTVAATPRPDAVGLTLTTLLAFQIEGMGCKQFLRLQDHLIDKVGCLLSRQATCLNGGVVLCLYQQGFPSFVGMIVGWGTDDML